MSLLPVVGKYQLIRKLATGGMAEVYLAKTAGAHGFEKTVVLKRILPHLAEDENFVHMFFSEAKLAAQLNHPNVVTVFDFGEEGGTYFLVMEYIDGPNLRALFKRANETKQPIPFGVVAKIISFACEGLAFAHDFIDPETNEPMNLVHRDISPDNVLLARNGGVKVVDFGIAKASNQTHHTRTGTIKGKFAYMPPEQLKGMVLDRRADIFALGIVLHELVAGVKPFDVASDATIMQAILYEKMKPATEARPDTPPALQAIIDRALEKDRDARYPDCRTMQGDLEKFIYAAGEPVGQHQLAQLVARLASPSSISQPPLSPKTPTHPSLAVATPGFVKDPPPASNANAQAVSSSQLIDVSVAVSQVAAPPAAPQQTAVTAPPQPQPSRPSKPHLEVVNDPGQVHIRSSAVLPIPAGEPKRSTAWVAVLMIGLLFLGAGGALVGVKLLGGSNEPAKVEPVVVAKADPPVQPPPAPEPVAVKPPEPAQPVVVQPEPVVAEGVEPAKPIAVRPGKKAVKAPRPDKKSDAKPAEPTKTEPPPPPAPLKVVIAETGTVSFRIRPFATVMVDGKYLGDTPLDPITLPVGTVTVTLINKDLGKELKVPFEVKAGSNVFKYNLAE